MSHHSLAHEAATLLACADKVCTFVTDKDAEREHVTRALQNNGYQTEEPRAWPFYNVRPSIVVIIGAVSRRNVLR